MLEYRTGTFLICSGSDRREPSRKVGGGSNETQTVKDGRRRSMEIDTGVAADSSG